MKRTLKNFLSLMAGDVASRLIGFLATVYLARVLEASAFGVVNIGLSVFGYLFLVANPGLQVLAIRNAAAAQGADEQRVQAMVSLRLTLAICLMVGAAIVAWLLQVSPLTREVTMLYCISLLPLAFFLDWFFHGKEAFALLSAAKIVNALVSAAAVFIFVRSPADIAWVPIGFALGNLAASLLLLNSYSRRQGSLRFVWRPDEWKNILTASAPIGVATFLAQSALNLPPIALGWLVSKADAGTFSAALKIIVVLLMMDRLLNALLLPAITRYFVQRRDDVTFLVSAAVKFLLIVAVPLTLVGILFSPFVMETIFGAAYVEAVPVLQILMGYFFCTLLNSIFVCCLIASGNEKKYTSALFRGSLLLVVAIVGGTLLAGANGAAWGVVVGELCTLLLMMRDALTFIPISMKPMLARHTLAAVGMVVCVVALSQHHVVAQAVGALIVFVVLAVALKLVGAEEMEFLRERVI